MTTTKTYKRVRVALIVCSVATMAMTSYLWPRQFAINDDVSITAFLRGGMPIPFISPFFSQIMATAYNFVPHFPWYGVCLYLGLLVACFGFLLATYHAFCCNKTFAYNVGFGCWYLAVIGCILIATSVHQELYLSLVGGALLLCIAVCRHRGRPFVAHGSAVLFGALVATCIAVTCLLSVTYTVASILCVGMAWILFAAATDTTKKDILLLAGILLAIGYCFRPEGIVAGTVSIAPILLWRSISARAPTFRQVLFFTIPLLAIVTSQQFFPHTKATEDDPFAEYTTTRGAIHVHASYEELDKMAPGVLESAGWSTQEYQQFDDWLFLDERVFTLDKLRRLASTGGAPKLDNIKTLFINWTSLYQVPLLCIGLIALQILWLLPLAQSKRTQLALASALCSTAAWIVIVPSYLLAFHRMPVRICWPMLLCVANSLLVILAKSRFRGTVKVKSTAITIGFVTISFFGLLFFLSGQSIQMQAKMNNGQTIQQKEMQKHGIRLRKDGNFVLLYQRNTYENRDPLVESPRHYDVATGWETFSPMFYQRIKSKLDVEWGYQILSAMVDNPHAYLLSHVRYKQLLTDYIEQATSRPVQLVATKKFDTAVYFRIVSSVRDYKLPK